MRAIDREEYKTICINMLNAFHNICENNNLRYLLDYGTLLGAVRHHGLIPWDDDIDVVMPRDDYEKLCALSRVNKSIFGKTIRLALPGGEYDVQKPYANLIDIRTITISSFRRKKYYYPIWIDVFPMDYAPANNEEFQDIVNKINIMYRKALRPTRKFDGKNRLLLMAYAVVFAPSITKRMIKIDRLAKSVDPSSFFTNFMGPYGVRDIIDNSYFDDFKLAEFEGNKYRISRIYEKRLATLYGDFMSLPPESERKPHIVEAYIKEGN